jgi:hypothetical protein
MLPGAQPGPTAIGGHQRAISESNCSVPTTEMKN